MNVSVIVVNYNTKQLTKECIESIFYHTHNISFEVILVDNGSSDGSKEIFSNDKRIIYIQSQENLGFGRANNLGYTKAKGKYVLLLNSDTLLTNNALKEFYDFAENTSDNVACIGCVLTGSKGEVIHSSGTFPTLLTIFYQLLNQYTSIIGWNLSPYKHPINITYYYPLIVDYITGADLFIKRTIIEKLGLFNPAFFMYFEETELQYRYKKNGYISLLIDTPKIIHLNGNRKKRISSNGIYLSTEGCFIYTKMIFNHLKYYLVRILFIIFLIPKLLILPISLKNKIKVYKLLFKKMK